MPAAEMTREVFWNIPSWAITPFYLATALAVAALGWLLWRRHLRVWVVGQRRVELADPRERLRSFVKYGLGQWKVAADPSAALMHALIYIGFLMLFVATCIVFVEERTSLRLLHGTAFLLFEAWGNTGGLLFLAGLALAAHRRYRLRPAQLTRNREDALLLLLLASIGVTGFLVQAARIAADPQPWSGAAYVGWSLASLLGLFGQGDLWRPLHQALWVLHFGLVALFFVTLPLTKLAHLFTAPGNTLFRESRPSGALEPALTPALPSSRGGKSFADLSWKRLMDYSACTLCGRCEAVCPAHLAGKPLSPREVVRQMGAEARERHGRLGAGAVPVSVAPEALWACTSCGACSEACPVFIRQPDTIVELRRNLVETGRVAPMVTEMLESLQRHGNPWGRPASTRLEWTQGLSIPTIQENPEPEILYWVGCAGAYDPTGQEVARAVAMVLKAAGVNFAILGTEERCTGDAARRVGEEGLFQMLAKRNVATLSRHGIRRIVTHCPHCLNGLKNEYAAFGGRYEVIHHSQLLDQLLSENRLALRRKLDLPVTYHDPCFLGRHNGEFDGPRRALSQLADGEVVEMGRSRETALCCGGGGGQMWMDGGTGERVNYLRFDEAAATGASLIATGCPFCKVMLDSSAEFRGAQDRIKVKDLAQIVAEAL